MFALKGQGGYERAARQSAHPSSAERAVYARPRRALQPGPWPECNLQKIRKDNGYDLSVENYFAASIAVEKKEQPVVGSL